jgi:signal transduction histidine kinase
VTERVRADEALRRSQTDLRELASGMDSVREQEKSRIAREIHDELGQALTALKLDVAWLAERLPAGQTAAAGKLNAMDAMIDATVAATRRISADLRPLVLDDLGLVSAAEWLVQEFTQRTGIPCELAVRSPDLELKDPQATAIFRILQESLTNVARHAQARRVEVDLARANGAVTLSVRDNGRGFNLGDPRRPSSFGLMGLRERVSLLGGEVRIESQPGRGTVLHVQIPLEEKAQAA